jgi:hypothetical protein
MTDSGGGLGWIKPIPRAWRRLQDTLTGGSTVGIRFSRRVTLFPGVRLNFSRRGISTTIGPRGASVNIGAGGGALNLGVPGTGLSFRHQLSSSQRPPPATPASREVPLNTVPAAPAIALESAPASEISSEGLGALRQLILDVRHERAALAGSILDAEEALEKAEDRLRTARSWFWGLFLKSKIPERQSALEGRTAELAELRERLAGTFVNADTNADEPTLAAYERLADAFVEVSRSQRIWDVTSSQENDRIRTRSRANVSVQRKRVSFSVAEQDPVLQTSARSLHLQNANGADLVIYAGFLLMETSSALALVDLREVDVAFSICTFSETEGIPPDSQVVGQTWAKVNKDGSPDRRFRDNYQIPIAQYGELALTSPTGLNEAYMCSNMEAARRFAYRFREYKAALATLGDREPATAGEPQPASGAPTTSQQPAFGSVAFLQGRKASDVDDAAQTMIGFAQLLQADLQSLNGKAPGVAGWSRFVTDITAVPGCVREFFARSPSARTVEPVAMREVNKMIKSVLDQVHDGLAAQSGPDAEVSELAAKVRAAAASLVDTSDLS